VDTTGAGFERRLLGQTDQTPQDSPQPVNVRTEQQSSVRKLNRIKFLAHLPADCQDVDWA
jgi:hypothetical protein